MTLPPPDALVKPSVREELRPFADRNRPRRHGAFSLVETFVRGGCPCKVVPENFWTQDVDDQGHPVAVVACPCGEEPRPGLGTYPAECRCQRWFFYTGTAVFALNSPRPA